VSAGAPRVLSVVVRAAAGLAAVFFPASSSNGVAVTTRRHVCFVLDGHVDAWAGWATLSEQDARRFGRLLRRRPNQLANAEVAGPLLDRLLTTSQLPGCAPADDYTNTGRVIVSTGMPLRTFIDATLDELDDLVSANERTLPAAEPGPHHTTIRVPGCAGTSDLVDVRYDIRPHHVTGIPEPPAIVDAAPMDTVRVPLAELEGIAAALDAVHGTAYRAEAVRRFHRQLREHGSSSVKALDMAAGWLNELIAYTGFGKSVVLIETFACWAARNRLVVTFVLPTNADVVRNTHLIERGLAATGIQATVTALISPRSVFEVAQQSAHRSSGGGPDADWVWRRLGYGCALPAAGVADVAVDSWQPGHEPCGQLHAPPRNRQRKDRIVACPWRNSCDRFRLIRVACTADIIVTTHANLQFGRLQAPVHDGLGVTDRTTVEELVLRRSHLIVIDEVDTFQQFAIDRAGRGLVLDRAGDTNTPLRRFDGEFGSAFGRVRDEVDANVRDALHLTRYLSELYVSHLAYARLGTALAARRGPLGPSRRWVVPRRWDAWLTARLFGLPGDAEVTDEQMHMFQSLFPGETAVLPSEPAVFAQIRPHLRAVTTSGLGGQAIAAARAELDDLLEGLVIDERDAVISRLLRRAILEPIRVALHRLMANTPQLIAAGVESTQAIADALGPYGRWRVTPTGPLGRLVFAFTEYQDDTGNEPTRLHTAAFGGDPHVYTISLGDTTALAHAGTRRIVLGLSATAYFPLAPHHHVHIQPRWWVSDDHPGTVTVLPAPIEREDQSLIKVSGLDRPARAEATRLLARLLWARRLQAELLRLQHDDPGRARVLLATTSYEAAQHVAEGLAHADVAPSRICLAVRPRADAPYDPDRRVVTDAGRWLELPADRLDDFPAVPGADILIAPLARVQRGINIIGEGDRSALGSVWLIVRPIPLIDEPSELVAHIQAKALADHDLPANDPLIVLQQRRDTAGRYFEEIVRRPPYFQAQPHQVKLGVVAEIVNGAIQLIGRARRGGTAGVLHLVDGAFLDPKGGVAFATLLRALRDAWERTGVLDQMRQLYGTTLEAFFTYADLAALTGDDSDPSRAAAC
jgi:hypothetical protein